MFVCGVCVCVCVCVCVITEAVCGASDHCLLAPDTAECGHLH